MGDEKLTWFKDQADVPKRPHNQIEVDSESDVEVINVESLKVEIRRRGKTLRLRFNARGEMDKWRVALIDVASGSFRRELAKREELRKSESRRKILELEKAKTQAIEIRTQKEICVAERKKELEDCSKRLGQLCWRLNEKQVSAAVEEKLMKLCDAASRGDWATANSVHVEMTTQHWDECSGFLTALKRLLKTRSAL